jgi:hypothetical protein
VQVEEPDGSLRTVRVETGLATGGLVEVTPVDGALEAGDLVVVGRDDGSPLDPDDGEADADPADPDGDDATEPDDGPEGEPAPDDTTSEDGDSLYATSADDE